MKISSPVPELFRNTDSPNIFVNSFTVVPYASHVYTLNNATANLHLADCRDILPDMPAASIDMIFSDPPYGHKNNHYDRNAKLSRYRGLDRKMINGDAIKDTKVLIDAVLHEAPVILNPIAFFTDCALKMLE